ESQAWVWTAGYMLLVILVVCCGILVWRAPRAHVELDAVLAAPTAQAASLAQPATRAASTAIAAGRKPRRQPRLPGSAAQTAVSPQNRDPDAILLWRRLRWIGLAAAPTSLMLGVTTYLTTDIAAIPFFWVIPLGLYLLTFILVFARWPVVWVGTPHEILLYLQ